MKNIVNVYYHINYQHVNYKAGVIKLCVTQSSQSTEISFYHLKFDPFLVKGQDLKRNLKPL